MVNILMLTVINMVMLDVPKIMFQSMSVLDFKPGIISAFSMLFVNFCEQVFDA